MIKQKDFLNSYGHRYPKLVAFCIISNRKIKQGVPLSWRVFAWTSLAQPERRGDGKDEGEEKDKAGRGRKTAE